MDEGKISLDEMTPGAMIIELLDIEDQKYVGITLLFWTANLYLFQTTI